MKIQSTARTAILLGIAAVLLACGKQATSANDSGDPVVAEPAATNTANSAVPANGGNVAAATPAAGGAPTPEFMVGKWSAMNEDCSATLEFHKDGTVDTPIGEGKWTLVGDKLTFHYADASKQTPSTIRVLSPDRIEITRGSGRKETEKRC